MKAVVLTVTGHTWAVSPAPISLEPPQTLRSFSFLFLSFSSLLMPPTRILLLVAEKSLSLIEIFLVQGNLRCQLKGKAQERIRYPLSWSVHQSFAGPEY